MQKKWWMESVGYQIYPKSFFDSNDDGIGDLKGITQKLDQLKHLGINLIWICPFYDSPMDDNGYDVRDFYKVSPMFGDLNDLKTLIDKAHQLGFKIMLDFVLNHTSDEHPWFIESKKSKDNPYRDYYIWRRGRMHQGKQIPPNNWGSFFGGSAWQYDAETDQYYMKIFSNKMPDLNWENPKVRHEMKAIAQYYIDLGIDGFRIDAVSHLDRGDFKDTIGQPDDIILDWKKFSNLPRVMTYLKELNQEVFKPSNSFTIGEVGGEATITEALKFAAFKADALDTVFNFDHNWCNNLWDIDDLSNLKTDVICLKKAFKKWHDAFESKGFLPLNWLNHDQPRLMSHYGSTVYPKKSGKMLATALYFMRGIPFIYQGEEIGMTNYPFKKIEEFNDVATLYAYHDKRKKHPNMPEEKLIKELAKTTRDHPRTPYQWSDAPHAGFTKGNPWLSVNPNYRDINLENQINDPDSLWSYYQKVIHLRRFSNYRETIIYGSYKILDFEHPNLYTYIRCLNHQILLVISSFSEDIQTYDLKTYDIIEVVLHNDKHLKINGQTITLNPYEAIVLSVKERI
ncbi:MAG: glycoside hydrolase family 13 protein [Acholeplasmataceae bacterium]